MKKFHVTNIDWYIEPEDCNYDPQIANEILKTLPNECDVECEDDVMIAETLYDTYSKTYGYLIKCYITAYTIAYTIV